MADLLFKKYGYSIIVFDAELFDPDKLPRMLKNLILLANHENTIPLDISRHVKNVFHREVWLSDDKRVIEIKCAPKSLVSAKRSTS